MRISPANGAPFVAYLDSVNGSRVTVLAKGPQDPHFVDANPTSTHPGETRETRLAEYLEENETPVVGIREGSWIAVDLDPQLVFTTPVEDRWTAALATLGIDPARMAANVVADA